MEKERIAIIPARGGSKRIPRKNIKLFCGRPIIEYSIKSALDSGCFDEIVVSTDDEEIATIAKKAGATVPFMRSKVNSNDYATITDVICEVIDEYEKNDLSFKIGCCIYPTAPFVNADKIRNAISLLKETESDIAISVVEYSFPPQRGIYLDNNLCLPVKEECMNMRSQDLRKIYHDCGQLFAFDVLKMMKNKTVWGGKVSAFELSEIEVQDIDTEIDWQLAELKYQLLKRNSY